MSKDQVWKSGKLFSFSILQIKKFLSRLFHTRKWQKNVDTLRLRRNRAIVLPTIIRNRLQFKCFYLKGKGIFYKWSRGIHVATHDLTYKNESRQDHRTWLSKISIAKSEQTDLVQSIDLNPFSANVTQIPFSVVFQVVGDTEPAWDIKKTNFLRRKQENDCDTILTY